MDEKLKNIITLDVNDTDFEEENEGIVIVKVFDKSKIGVCVSKRYGGDAELWLDSEETEKLIIALEDALLEYRSNKA